MAFYYVTLMLLLVSLLFVSKTSIWKLRSLGKSSLIKGLDPWGSAKNAVYKCYVIPIKKTWAFKKSCLQ